VYDGLWALAERSPDFTTLVKPGNRIKYNSVTDRAPIKEESMVADLPEVALVCAGTTANLYNTSSTSSCERNYSWIINTGDFRVNEFLHQVEWAIFVAMFGWRDILTALQWSGKSFVKHARILEVTQGQSNQSVNRGIRGWSAVWSCSVLMYFDSADILAILPAP